MARYASLVRTASIPGTPQAWTRRLLRCGVAAGPVFVAVFLLEGAVRDGYSPTDPVSGYPPGTPDALTRPSRAGAAHNLAAVPVFFGLPAAALACSWRSWRAGQRGFALYSGGTAVTMVATMAPAAAGFGQSPRLVNLGGLFQRASIITGFTWLTARSARALQRPPATRSAKPPAP